MTNDPLALDAGDDAQARVPAPSTCSSTGSPTRRFRRFAARRREEMARAPERAAARGAAGVRRDPRRLDERRAAVHEQGDHPGFFAFIPFAGTWPGALGDFIASALNVYAGSWMESAGPSQVELEVLGWFKDWIGYPAEAAGLLVSGGSAANLTALACAREAHVGVDVRRPRRLRLRPGALVDRASRAHPRLPAGPGSRDPVGDELPACASTCSRRRWTPTPRPVASRSSSSANGGATNTGAVDPLAELADALPRARRVAARRRGVRRFRGARPSAAARRSPGIELADSVTLDPHKWLYQPYECGCLLVRDGAALAERVLDHARLPEGRGRGRAGEVNFSDLGLQLTRMSRAFKVWLLDPVLRARRVPARDRAVARARRARARADRGQRQARARWRRRRSAIVCFRRRFDGARRGARR